MMASSSLFPEGLRSVRLEVTPGSQIAEVFLIDHAFALVDRSVGDLVADVEPGVYKVKARLGEATTEQLVVMSEDRQLDLSDELRVASPAPIRRTSQTREYHRDVAQEGSSEVTLRVGDGARIFLMTRRFSGSDVARRGGAPNPSDLSLHSSEGELLADLGREGHGPRWAPDPADPALGLTIAVDPGGYLLRWSGSAGITVEQSVHAVASWQTQVFLLEEAAHDGRHRVSVLMSHEPFDPENLSLLAVEEARSALADERMVASAAVNEALFAKFDNPMLGLFGAHLMLVAAEGMEQADEADRRGDVATRPPSPAAFDQSLFEEAVSNLRGLLGSDHPDVVALSTKTRGQALDDLHPVTVPPMLWRSWVLLIEASNRAPHLLPPRTWWPTVRQLPLRPFLVWAPGADEGSRKAWADTIRSELARTSSPHDAETRERLSRQLLVPRAVIDDLAPEASVPA